METLFFVKIDFIPKSERNFGQGDFRRFPQDFVARGGKHFLKFFGVVRKIGDGGGNVAQHQSCVQVFALVLYTQIHAETPTFAKLADVAVQHLGRGPVRKSDFGDFCARSSA